MSESNRRPAVYKTAALPAELTRRGRPSLGGRPGPGAISMVASASASPSCPVVAAVAAARSPWSHPHALRRHVRSSPRWRLLDLHGRIRIRIRMRFAVMSGRRRGGARSPWSHPHALRRHVRSSPRWRLLDLHGRIRMRFAVMSVRRRGGGCSISMVASACASPSCPFVAAVAAARSPWSHPHALRRHVRSSPRWRLLDLHGRIRMRFAVMSVRRRGGGCSGDERSRGRRRRPRPRR